MWMMELRCMGLTHSRSMYVYKIQYFQIFYRSSNYGGFSDLLPTLENELGGLLPRSFELDPPIKQLGEFEAPLVYTSYAIKYGVSLVRQGFFDVISLVG